MVKEHDKLEFVGMSAKCRTQSAKRRNCVAILMPPSDEVRVSGGDLCEAEALTEPAGET